MLTKSDYWWQQSDMVSFTVILLLAAVTPTHTLSSVCMNIRCLKLHIRSGCFLISPHLAAGNRRLLHLWIWDNTRNHKHEFKNNNYLPRSGSCCCEGFCCSSPPRILIKQAGEEQCGFFLFLRSTQLFLPAACSPQTGLLGRETNSCRCCRRDDRPPWCLLISPMKHFCLSFCHFLLN